MSTSANTTTGWHFSLHLMQMFRFDDDANRRALDREVLLSIVEEGDRYPHMAPGPVEVCRDTIAGIEFHVLVNTADRKIVTAYPVACNRMEAIISNRWTQEMIRGIDQRIEEGRTEMQQHGVTL